MLEIGLVLSLLKVHSMLREIGKLSKRVCRRTYGSWVMHRAVHHPMAS